MQASSGLTESLLPGRDELFSLRLPSPIKVAAGITVAVLTGATGWLASSGLASKPKVIKEAPAVEEVVQSMPKFIPKAGVDKVLVKPSGPGLLVMPADLSKAKDLPVCLFSYEDQQYQDSSPSYLMRRLADGAKTSELAWLYGAAMSSQGVLACPTGAPADVIRGVLLCWDQPRDFQAKLYVVDELIGYDAGDKKNAVRRGVVSVVSAEGESKQAVWYYSGDSKPMAKAVVTPPAPPGKLKVLVTGASGRTGSIVFRKLLERSDQFEVTASVRSDKSRQKLWEAHKDSGKPFTIVQADITQGPTALVEALRGQDALVIVTSAIPKIVYSSLAKVILGKVIGKKMSPTFYYDESPQQVDWEGQKAQIDAAKWVGTVKHVVLVSSMGGSDVNNFLNTMGNANILLWKRKAEMYLKQSGLTYTIIHPGGLLPEPNSKAPSPGGERELLVGVDDKLLQGEKQNHVIPREDVAEVCMLSLTEPAAKNRAFDIASKPPGQGTKFNGNLAGLLSTIKGQNTDYSSPDVDKALGLSGW
eukprot:g28954.t1